MKIFLNNFARPVTLLCALSACMSSESREWTEVQRARIFLSGVQIGDEERRSRSLPHGRDVERARAYRFLLGGQSINTTLRWRATLAEDDRLIEVTGRWGDQRWRVKPERPLYLLSEARQPLTRAASSTIEVLQPWRERTRSVTLTPNTLSVGWASDALSGRVWTDERGVIQRAEEGPVLWVADGQTDFTVSAIDTLLGADVGPVERPRGRRLLQFEGPSVRSLPESPPFQRKEGDRLYVESPLWEEIPRRPFQVLAGPDSAIRRRAIRWVGASTDVKSAVRALVRGVNGALVYQPTPGSASALGALLSGVGDCDEHARLFVQAARSVGVEARAVSGWIVIGRRLVPHAWAEVQMGLGWTPVDPAFSQEIADAARIRLGPLTDGVARRSLTALELKVIEAR